MTVGIFASENIKLRKGKQKMGKIDTVLFDFDGTIMDTNKVILMSWQHTFRTLRNREESEDVLVKTFGEPLERTIKNFFPDIPTDEAIEVYGSYHRDNFGELISLFPGVKEMLAEVKRRGYKTAVVTSRLLNTTMQGMEKYGIDGYFDTVVTAEDTTRHKPDPQPVEVALAKLGSLPERSVMLGDTTFDIMCAKNAGVKAVLVSWSLALAGKDEKEMGDAAPDCIIDKPEDIFDII